MNLCVMFISHLLCKAFRIGIFCGVHKLKIHKNTWLGSYIYHSLQWVCLIHENAQNCSMTYFFNHFSSHTCISPIDQSDFYISAMDQFVYLAISLWLPKTTWYYIQLFTDKQGSLLMIVCRHKKCTKTK